MRDVIEEIDAALRRKGLTDAAASKLAVGNLSLIKNMRAQKSSGKRYSFQALEHLAQVLDLELYFGPDRSKSNPTSLAFSPTETLPLKGFAACSVQGWGRPQPQDKSFPKPISVTDPGAFYVRAHGQSMIPEGIPPSALCVVSPSTFPQENDRVYVEEYGGRTAIKRLIRKTERALFLRGWLPIENGKQTAFEEERPLAFITACHPIQLVMRGTPGTPSSPTVCLDDPRAAQHLPTTQTETTPLQTDEIIFSHSWQAKNGLSNQNLQLASVTDDAMSPTIRSGANILIAPHDQTLITGNLYAVKTNTSISVRRVEILPQNLVLLKTDNPNFASTILDQPPNRTSEILGRVVWYGQSVL
jgi:phage repressor protein C with HTH and peptisase S24 domain